MADEKFEPKIVGFFCNWCTYTGADLAGVSRTKYPPNVTPIRVMCSGRVDPLLVINALQNGADGVLIGGCHPGDCHYGRGNYFARRRIAILRKLLENVGIDPRRVKMAWVSASEGAKFAKVVKETVDEIRALGPIGQFKRKDDW